MRRIQLHEIHKRNAQLTVFASFELPVYYKGVAAEHMAVRNAVGVFDISHMGRVTVEGVDSEHFLNYVITNDVSTLSPNGARYSVMCNENGGIKDDFVVYRLEAQRFLVVFNASNREKDYAWLARNMKGFNVSIDDISDHVAMFAVQGPKAEKTLQEISTENLSNIGRFRCMGSRLADVEVLLSRTGYTGEDGFEIFVWNASTAKPDSAVKLWKTVLETGEAFGIESCGLGARDTLRLEAGLCLYGNDIDETVTPLEAGLSFTVKFAKEQFIGKESLMKRKTEGIKQRRVGLRMLDRGVPRAGFEIFTDAGEKVGRLTSGTFSPLLHSGIAMGYVQTPYADEGNSVKVKVRDKMINSEIVLFPLYDTEKYGYKRKI
jgi:aminomethyltransferase